jgi:hypothetical protein
VGNISLPLRNTALTLDRADDVDMDETSLPASLASSETFLRIENLELPSPVVLVAEEAAVELSPPSS